MIKKTKITSTILLSALLLGVAVTSMSLQTAFAGPPLACGDTIFVDTVLTANLNCTDVTGGLTIGAIDVELDLNGWNITCTGTGYQANDPLPSCQSNGTIGVDQNGQTGMTVTGPGTIYGFTIGVLVDATGANVKDLTISGPAAPPGCIPFAGCNNRPIAQNGIRVVSIECPDDFDTTVNIHGNDISNHTEGVALLSANCVNVHHNVIHDNNSDPIQCSGILLDNSDNNKIHHNDVSGNGENLGIDAGIIIRSGSDNNMVHQNDVSNNFGEGISVRDTSDLNKVFQNNAFGNTFLGIFDGDLVDDTGILTNNSWTKNCFDNETPAGLSTESNKCPIKNAGA